MQLSSSARSQYSHTPMDLTTTTLEALSKRELKRLCREHQLSPHGLKAQLLTGLRAHRASLTTSASSSGQPVAPSQPSTSSSQTATDAPPVHPRAAGVYRAHRRGAHRKQEPRPAPSRLPVRPLQERSTAESVSHLRARLGYTYLRMFPCIIIIFYYYYYYGFSVQKQQTQR